MEQPLGRATVRQRKTGHPVRFELAEQTREAIDAYLKAHGKRGLETSSSQAGAFRAEASLRDITRGSCPGGSQALVWMPVFMAPTP